jgi:hypothetical protein
MRILTVLWKQRIRTPEMEWCGLWSILLVNSVLTAPCRGFDEPGENQNGSSKILGDQMVQKYDELGQLVWFMQDARRSNGAEV